MPKRISVEAKRVPLNCLVLPETLLWLQQVSMSQGRAVDKAVKQAKLASGALLRNSPEEKRAALIHFSEMTDDAIRDAEEIARRRKKAESQMAI